MQHNPKFLGVHPNQLMKDSSMMVKQEVPQTLRRSMDPMVDAWLVNDSLNADDQSMFIAT